MPEVKKQTPPSSSPAPNRSQTTSTPTTGVLSRIRPMTIDPYMRFLLYGKSGTGKTTVWQTFPGPILVLLCSGGMRPGELKSVRPENRAKIKELVVNETNDLEEVVKYITGKGSSDWPLVVLDHLSAFQDLELKEYLNLPVVPVQKQWGTASQQDWGAIGIRLKERLRRFLSIPAHTVIVAQERTFKKDEEASPNALEGIPFVGAAVTPGVAGWLNPASDYIVQTFIRPKMRAINTKIGEATVTNYEPTGQMEYCARVGPSDTFMTKFRMSGPSKPDVVVDPDYTKLSKLITGSVK